jgi:Mg-chelatase subunit ChlD
MNTRIFTVIAGLAFAHHAAAQPLDQDHAPVPGSADRSKQQSVAQPTIDVVFVLDTTGSMSGLIDGAKQKIWAIANQVITAKPRPEVRMGLVGYRDRGDAYVTTLTPLTADLDAVYSSLMGYAAGGGGDGPESVNQALAEAVAKFEWSEDSSTLKLIYLVGDAPPHMDYEQDQQYQATCEQAAKAGIIINTIQCGADPSTTTVWQEVARLAEGEFFQIQQDGGVAVIETPFDQDMARLGAEIDRTLIMYGDAAAWAAQQQRLESNEAIVAAAPASAQAERAAYKSAAAGDTLTGAQELVRDLEEKKVELKDIPEAHLPEELRGKSEAERQAIIDEKADQRRALLAQIADLQAKRQKFIDEKTAESAAAGNADSFDARVLQTLIKQAAAKGIKY